ncbi:MAG: glycosyltransferase family 39 protein [Chloroflexota bacterium]
MPPFAEMAVLHLYVLAASDRLANLVQWASLLVSLVAVSLIAARLDVGRSGQAFAVLFAATLPMGILQAASTQNDYVTGLWVLCLAYYAVKAHLIGLRGHEWVLAAIATGLGMLTKATFYGYALPFVIWLGIATVRRRRWLAAGCFTIVGMVLVALLNAGAWSRNLRAYQSPLGPSQAIAAHGNQAWGWKVIVSNAVRGLTLHLATPWGDANGLIRQAVVTLHQWIGLDVNDPRTTMGEYRVKRSFHEDYAGNPFHALLVPVSLLVLVWPMRRQPGGEAATSEAGPVQSGRMMSAAVIASAATYFLLYKWQATGSRLQLGLFLLWAPVVGDAFARIRGVLPWSRLAGGLQLAAVLVLTGASLRPLLMNPSRPLLPRSSDGISLWNTPRAELLFINAPEFMAGYQAVIDVALHSGCQAIGLKIDSSHPEYPFWALLAPPGSGVRLEHVDVPPHAAGRPPPASCAPSCAPSAVRPSSVGWSCGSTSEATTACIGPPPTRPSTGSCPLRVYSSYLDSSSRRRSRSSPLSTSNAPRRDSLASLASAWRSASVEARGTTDHFPQCGQRSSLPTTRFGLNPWRENGNPQRGQTAPPATP